MYILQIIHFYRVQLSRVLLYIRMVNLYILQIVQFFRVQLSRVLLNTRMVNFYILQIIQFFRDQLSRVLLYNRMVNLYILQIIQFYRVQLSRVLLYTVKTFPFLIHIYFSHYVVAHSCRLAAALLVWLHSKWKEESWRCSCKHDGLFIYVVNRIKTKCWFIYDVERN